MVAFHLPSKNSTGVGRKMRLIRIALRHRILLAVLLCPIEALAARADGANAVTGEQIYRLRCASCHGVHGEGTDENYPQRLSGDKSVLQLARFIAKSMPKGPAKKCTA